MESKVHRDKASHQLIEHGAKLQEQPVGWITTSTGHRVDSLTASLSVGKRGPVLLEDTLLLEELAHFDHERTPERVVYAKGVGAFGHFEVTHDITRYTKATVFNLVGKRTPLVTRFSGLCTERGSPDTLRDPRGFSIKFYNSDDGVWDLVCSNMPVYAIRDPLLFPSYSHALKKNPQTNLTDRNMFWDFVSLRPETLHQTLMLFSDRGIPDGYRHMNGYGVNTYKLVSHENTYFYCKFHLKTNQGIKNLQQEDALNLSATDPDYATRDLFNSIAHHEFPSWTLYIQVMTPEQAEKLEWNPFDATKAWPHKDFPLIEAGKITLDKNPRNYFADVEEVAFSPSNMIPGIEPSPDKMLQARLFSYADSQRHRIGPNYKQLPINCHTPIKNYQRDGPMCVSHNHNGEPNYFPNSFSGPIPDKTYRPIKYDVNGTVQRYENEDGDDYEQPRFFWTTIINEDERRSLAKNLAENLKDATEFIQERVVSNLNKIDPDCGGRVMEAIKSQ